MKQSLPAGAERQQTRQSQPVAEMVSAGKSQSFVDNRPEALAQRKLAAALNNSPRMVAQRKLHAFMNGSTRQLQAAPEEELLQGKFEAVQRVENEESLQGKFAPQFPAQLEPQTAAKPNNAGLPDNLKSGIETLSGLSMDSVQVHYNSSQPAQLNALAYAQGTDIHVAPGQEQHLPHEAWHVVQQAQGRVQPTMQMKDGVPVNDDQGLEHEADVMGEKVFSAGRIQGTRQKVRSDPIAQKVTTIQRLAACYSRSSMGFADAHSGNWFFETIGSVRYQRTGATSYTLTDGSNTGLIRHYVPSNWISKNIIDQNIIGFKRHEVITRLSAILVALSLAVPNHDTSRADGFDAWVSDSIDAICDWQQNLFRNQSTGDGGGTQLDVPNDVTVLNRVEQARATLIRWGIGHKPND